MESAAHSLSMRLVEVVPSRYSPSRIGDDVLNSRRRALSREIDDIHLNIRIRGISGGLRSPCVDGAITGDRVDLFSEVTSVPEHSRTANDKLTAFSSSEKYAPINMSL